MNISIASVTASMREELGNPNPSTEISDVQIERQWYRALDEFNHKVGQLELRLFNVTPGQQLYKIKAMFPTETRVIRDIKKVFYLIGENVYNQIVEEYVTGGTATQMVTSATYYASGTLLASATYMATGTMLTSATYMASGTLLTSATYYASSTLVSSATYYASGVEVHPDYWDSLGGSGTLLVPQLISDGTVILVDAVWTDASATLTASATYYASGTLINPDYYDVDGVLLVSATTADGTQISASATYIRDGSLMSASATYSDGTDLLASATYSDGTDLLASATYADGSQVSASATYTDSRYGYYDYDLDVATSTATDVNNAITITTDNASLQVISELYANSANPLYERDFQFLDPDTLLLVPAPVDSGALLVLIKADFSSATLPDMYERIVTDYAIARCQDIVGNGRARLNTPQRQGDFIKYASREKTAYQLSAAGKKKFEDECAAINIKRMF